MTRDAVLRGVTGRRVALPVLAAGVWLSLVGTGTELARADDPAACDTWDVEYRLSAKVKITGTSMGIGDGTFATGPGRLVLRFEKRKGAAGEAVKVLDFRMRDHFTVNASMLIASASVTAETVTVTTPDACGASASGVRSGNTLQWDGPWRGMHSDGTLHCEGALCGKFGAPPSGDSPVGVGPHPVTFEPFRFSDDGQTFTMAYSVTSSQRSPAQTSHLTFAGREVKRSCVTASPCGSRT